MENRTALLSELYQKWIKLHDDLRKKHFNLAAPFFSVPHPMESTTPIRPVLLVGKATDGCWYLEEYDKKHNLPVEERVTERLDTTRAFLQNCVLTGEANSAFWKFWNCLQSIDDAPAIWTNIAKIGDRTTNPDENLLKEQEALAISTLRAEIEVYKPRLIVVVTGDFAGRQIVEPVFNPDGANWEKDKSGQWPFWWLKQVPPVLWTYHPQGKSNNELERWCSKAKELLNREV